MMSEYHTQAPLNATPRANPSNESLSLPPEIAATWLIAIRTAMVSIGLLSSTIATFFFQPALATHSEWVFSGFAFLFFANGALAMWSRYQKTTEAFLTLQIGFDYIIVLSILLMSGGPNSTFIFLFIPFQLIAGTFLRENRSLLLALLGSLGYGALCLTDSALSADEAFAGQMMTSGRLFLQWLSVTASLVVIHKVTVRVKRSILQSLEGAHLSRAAAESLAADYVNLVEGLPEAVIAVNAHGDIQAMNGSATELFGIRKETLLGKPLSIFTTCLKEQFGISKPLEAYSAWDEITLHDRSRSKKPQRVIFHRSTSGGTDSESLVTFYLFRDISALRSVEEQLALQEQMARALSETEKSDTSATAPSIKLAGFVGESPAMTELFRLIERVSPTDSTVLISGESGTGKELVAKAIHLQSNRSQMPFIPINCGAIPEQLLESELFGHRKGSFTGAIADHPGIFQQAAGGTVFLDEIGEMPLPMQAKLLRAIQEKTIRSVGAKEAVAVDVRILAATNKELQTEVANGRFREDLFYRLNVIALALPPLRERVTDIPLLIHSILKRQAKGETLPAIAPQALQLLTDYQYPGNVRELENILERALVLGGDAILPEHLPDAVHQKRPAHSVPETEIIVRDDLTLPINLDALLRDIEEQYLMRALEETAGVKTQAAELLGMNFRSFRYRLKKLES